MSVDSRYARVEELFERYLSEGSVEKIFALYYALSRGGNDAREAFQWKFGSVRPLVQVLEDLRGVGIEGYWWGSGQFVADLMSTRAMNLIVEDSLKLCKDIDETIKKVLAMLLLISERNGSLPGDIKVGTLRMIYTALSGELVDEGYWVDRVIRMLSRMHLIDSISRSEEVNWTSWASSLLKALKGRIPEVKVEFEEPMSK